MFDKIASYFFVDCITDSMQNLPAKLTEEIFIEYELSNQLKIVRTFKVDKTFKKIMSAM